MTTGPTIDYEALQQDAMRNVIRSVLIEVERNGGLPGEHHFYISFNTKAPGVILSRRLKEKYQHEMTIVLQHRFWGLVVTEDRFEVNLTFDGIPERLVIPFQSIRVFVDPSVRYGLQFEVADIGPDPQAFDLAELADTVENAADLEGELGPETVKRAERKPRTSKRTAKTASGKATNKKSAADQPAADAPSDEDAKIEPAAAQAAGGPANVVSLDAFRKR
ncbi:MAG: hypothetical protein KDJ45_11455 [Hyphomicrobiaceae bacterium]|nr:hypothetical protein [Hyphomicrobiaceae bacterium]MCC0011324.1 hypothetical protein [Hyphomicrobiaceae bacterium]